MHSRVFWLVVICVIGVLVFLFKRYKVPPNLQVEKLILTDEDGEEVPNPIEKKGVQVIVVWATWCPPCIREIPLLDEIINIYTNHDDVHFYMISDEDMIKQKKFKEKKGFSMPLFRLKSGSMHEIGVFSIPCTFIYKEGSVQFKKLGQWTSKKELIDTIEKARK